MTSLAGLPARVRDAGRRLGRSLADLLGTRASDEAGLFRALLAEIDRWASADRANDEVASDVARAATTLREKLSAPAAPELSFVGAFKAGKSSILNALLGRDDLAPVDVLPKTARVTFFRHGPDEDGLRVRLREDGVWRDSDVFTFRRLQHGTELGEDEEAALAAIQAISVECAVPALRRVVLVDTPGFHSGTEADDDAALAELAQTAAFVWVTDIHQGDIQDADLAVLRWSAGPVPLVNVSGGIRGGRCLEPVLTVRAGQIVRP